MFAGTFTASPTPATAGVALFRDGGERAALVRISRGGGLPEAVPDVRGCAIRVVDAHGPGRDQDLLLASSLSRPVGRHVLMPGRDFGGAFYSSLLPYDVGGRRLVFGAAVAGRAGTTLDEVERSVARGPLRIHLLAASPLGRWEGVAEVTLERLAHEAGDLRFNPWVTGGGIEPVGMLQALRDPAYRASQASGWAVPGH